MCAVPLARAAPSPPHSRGTAAGGSQGSDGGINSAGSFRARNCCSHGPKQRKKLVEVARARSAAPVDAHNNPHLKAQRHWQEGGEGRGDLRGPLRSALSYRIPADLCGMSSCSGDPLQDSCLRKRIHANKISCFSDYLIPS